MVLTLLALSPALVAVLADLSAVFSFTKDLHVRKTPTSSAAESSVGGVIARSAGREMYVDNVLMLNNQLDNHISTQGWAGPVNREPLANPAKPGVHAGWREYGSVNLQGKAADLTARKYGRVLKTEELPFTNSRTILQRYWPDFDYTLLNSK